MSISSILNAMAPADMHAALTGCCAAELWVDGMMGRRPFRDDAAVMAAAEDAAAELVEGDWLEAFSAHPMIGDVESLREKYAATKQVAAGEQSRVAETDEATRQELARLNHAYRDKFGFIFIVFATGKSAAEMLSLLKSRIGNSRDEELKNAAREQLKITKLRLEKLAAITGDA